jgi:hypothetical protein
MQRLMRNEAFSLHVGNDPPVADRAGALTLARSTVATDSIASRVSIDASSSSPRPFAANSNSTCHRRNSRLHGRRHHGFGWPQAALPLGRASGARRRRGKCPLRPHQPIVASSSPPSRSSGSIIVITDSYDSEAHANHACAWVRITLIWSYGDRSSSGRPLR